MQVDDSSSVLNSFERDSRKTKSPLFSMNSDELREAAHSPQEKENFTIHWVERIALRKFIKWKKEEKAEKEAKLFGVSAAFLKSDKKTSRKNQRREEDEAIKQYMSP